MSSRTARLKVPFDLSQRAGWDVAAVHGNGRDAVATTDGEMPADLPDLDASPPAKEPADSRAVTALVERA